MLLQAFQWLFSIQNVLVVVYTVIGLAAPLALAVILLRRFEGDFEGRHGLKQLRRLGVPASHMTDQLDEKFDIPEDMNIQANEPIRIKALFIHPIKSCGPIEVDRALLTKTGFLYDRLFAFAAESPPQEADGGPCWKLITQRTLPLMSQVKTELLIPRRGDNLQEPLIQADGRLVVSFPDPDYMPNWTETLWTFLSKHDPQEISFVIPLQPTPAQVKELDLGMRTFTIHAREARGLDLSRIPSVAAALPKLKSFLGVPRNQNLALMRCTSETLTRTTKNLAPLADIGTPAVHGYTDQQPININSLSSVHALSALLPPENRPLDALRFRANIWVEGAPAYAEETWKRIRIVPKDFTLRAKAETIPALSVVCRTSRCTMPNVNLDRGTFDTDNPLPGRKRGMAQPSTTLKQHRTVETGNPAALGYLGMHCVPEDRALEDAEEQEKGVYIEVGDTLEVLQVGEHLYGSTGDDY